MARAVEPGSGQKNTVNPRFNRRRIPDNEGAIRTLRVVQWIMLASILLYVVAGEVIGARTQTIGLR